jgi:predicted metalloprotease
MFNPNARLDPGQVQDRRRGGMAGPIAVGGGGLGIIGLIIAMLLGVNPGDIGIDTTGITQPQAQQQAQPAQSTAECRTGADANARADCRVVGFANSIQSYWSQEFQRRGWEYAPAQTVLFSGATNAACGMAQSAQGPFYCPLDQQVYLDLSFFQDLQSRFGAQGGPFAEGYIIAHEYGHHLQNILGLLPEGGQGTTGAQGTQVRVELMADCMGGVWARHAADSGFMQAPTDQDVGRAIDAAGSVGDDRIQRQMQGRITPDSFTHGSSEQRMTWFKTGYQSGNLDACNTLRGRV